QLHSGTQAGAGQAVPDADRGRVFDHGPRDGGDGPRRAGGGEDRGRVRDRGDPAHEQDGGDGSGDVPEDPGRGSGRGQHRPSLVGDGEARRGGGPGAGEARLDHAAYEVQGAGVHPDQGGGRPSHAVLQRVSAAVLLPDDGRDGGGEPAGRDGDGDARGQRGDDGGADHADRDGQDAAV